MRSIKIVFDNTILKQESMTNINSSISIEYIYLANVIRMGVNYIRSSYNI